MSSYKTWLNSCPLYKNMKLLWKRIIKDKWAYLIGLIFIALSTFQGYVGRKGLNVPQINGIIMCVCMILLSWQLILTQGRWFVVCILGSLVQLVKISIAIFVFGMRQSTPGLVIAFLTLIYQFIINQYLHSQLKDREMLKKIATTDSLTNLINRYGFEEVIEDLLKKNQPFYLMFLDLDNFKYVNDTLGHEAGDEVLQKVASYWNNISSYKYHTLCRLGGDEFALIVKTSKLQAIETIKKEVLEVSNLDDLLLKNISVSVGIVNCPKDAKDRKTLLSYADSAMYRAKANGKNQVQFFNKEIHDETVKEYETRLRIVNAIKENRFEMLYQPQFHSNENIYGFESLIRLKVDGEYISTQYFIDVAEKNNLIFDIDRFVIDKVTKDWSKTVRGSGKDLIVSVNVSGKHLIAPGFLEEVIGTLAKNSFPPKNLCIEITEGAFVKSVVLAKEVINKLKLTGIKIALDDFGTKYSSLKYLQEFTTNHLKIEKSFTDTIKMDSSDNNIVNIIINIAHTLGCEVIAEGVETEDQLTYLRKHGCDIIQGYYYSEPLPFKNAVTRI